VKENSDKDCSNIFGKTMRWDWECLSENSGITMKDVIENPDMPWSWKYLSRNPNITIDFIKKNPDKQWDWDFLAQNKFFYDDTVFNKEYEKVKTKERQDYARNVFYANTDVCPDVINEILKYVSI